MTKYIISKKNNFYFILLFALILAILSLGVGRYPLNLIQILKMIFTGESEDKTAKIILFSVRLPRILISLFIGAALSASGSVYQTIFKNPLVSPSLLGASSGAAFGAVIGILLGFSELGIQISSFILGIVAVITAVFMGSLSKNRNETHILVLSGMIVSTFFTALISLVKFLADTQNTLPAITYWLMGSLADGDMNKVYIMGSVLIICSLILYKMSWRITILSLNDEEAQSLGINPFFSRIIIIICSTLLTSVAVSMSGIISWVGLVVPHIVRLWVPDNFSTLFLYSLFGGGIYLLIIDTLARVITPMEFPLGILTAIIGAPFFAFFLLKKRDL